MHQMKFVLRFLIVFRKYNQFLEKNIIMSYDVAHDIFSKNAKNKNIPGNTVFHNSKTSLARSPKKITLMPSNFQTCVI